MWEYDDACIKCSLCVSVCPVAEKDPRFPGPKVLGPDWWRKREELGSLLKPHPFVDDCTFCQLCEDACPVGVPVAHLIAEHKKHQMKPRVRRWRDFVLSHPQWIARAPQLTRLPRRWGKPWGLSMHTKWPQTHRPSKMARFQKSQPSSLPRVGLFADCFSQTFDGSVLDAASELLHLWGFEAVILPDAASCCGAAAYAAGNPELGAKIAGDTQSRFEVAHAHDISMLVTLNATCDSTLREEWSRYWHLSIPYQVIPFMEFALSYAPSSFWQILQAGEGSDLPYFIHTTCRSRVSRGSGTMEEIGRRAGWTVKPVVLSCCGAAGSYAFKQEHEELARKMGKINLPPGRLAVDSGTCALHLEDMTGLVARHPAYWLYESYQLAIGQHDRKVGSNHAIK